MTFWVGVGTAAFFLALTLNLVLHVPRLPRLRDVQPLADGELPVASIVFAARNEARGIEQALQSLLRLDYPRLEIIGVNDRSEDATGEILERMAAMDPRLAVVHVAELPPGWLGKNHALHLGAARARGELILFTDADIVMMPDTLRLAASYLLRERLDHLTAGPHVDMQGLVLKTFGVFFGVMFTVFSQPWKARDPRSPKHVGIGAFNLVRADTYRRIGGHQPIRLRPDDDMKLAKLVKKNGGTQDFVNGADRIRVEWYHGVGEAILGLRKNGFAGIDYRYSLVLLTTVTQILFFIWPYIAVFVTHGWTRAAYGVTVGLILLLCAGAAREQHEPVWLGVLVPVASVLFITVVWNAMLYTLIHRGIEWRGTHYPLDELRANKV
ncbi:MAG TPA: glycosyltransferase family 2 protein [Longimicrobium sp.]|nr:glycosyltransferase family 2 protein [Longimicrobium sp.]